MSKYEDLKGMQKHIEEEIIDITKKQKEFVYKKEELQLLSNASHISFQEAYETIYDGEIRTRLYQIEDSLEQEFRMIQGK